MFTSRLFKTLIVPTLCFACVVSAGFAMWIFEENLSQNKAVSNDIMLATSFDVGDAELLTPIQQGYEEYRLIFGQGGEGEISNEKVGIEFVPSITFDFYPYRYYEDGVMHQLDIDSSIFEGANFYYNLSFSSENAAVNKYAEFQNPGDVLLPVDLSLEKTTIAITPIFYYVNKPNTEVLFRQMLSELDSASGNSTITLKIFLRRP